MTAARFSPPPGDRDGLCTNCLRSEAAHTWACDICFRALTHLDEQGLPNETCCGHGAYLLCTTAQA